MVSADTARTVVGIIGNIISLGLFLSPLPTFVKIVREKAVQQFSPMPYLATLMNCTLWVVYGLPFIHPHSVLVLTINGTGMLLEAIYLAVFFSFSPRKLRKRIIGVIIGEAIFVAAVLAGVLTGAHTQHKRTQIVGILCVIFGTCMYAAPLSIMKSVIQEKSVKYMPFSLSFVSLLNGVCWTAYALIKFDLYITIPNVLGTALSLAQLVLYFYYYRSSCCTEPSDEEAPNDEIEMQLPESSNARVSLSSNGTAK
ncbi:hypothetical protein LUZ60_008267 [Juncus effusus]|nr:hypothetical protein LUZ60_008267 [Juncus effusus]